MKTKKSLITKAGFNFAFDEDACSSCRGKCCCGQTGYVWLSSYDIDKIVLFLKTNFVDFKEKFLRKKGNKFALKEKDNPTENGFECIFFDSIKMECSIYEARPAQCKEYPFWQEFKKDITFLFKECPGVTLLK